MKHTVVCQECNNRLSTCPTNEHGFPLAAMVFTVGNRAADSMGHAMFFTNTGRVALCIAKRQPAVTHSPEPFGGRESAE